MTPLITYALRASVRLLPPHVAELGKHMIEKIPPDLSRLLLAPMPGLLTRLDVAVGDKVEPGQPVAVMEAMKMENILRAAKAATVKATPVAPGESVAVDQVIVVRLTADAPGRISFSATMRRESDAAVLVTGILVSRWLCRQLALSPLAERLDLFGIKKKPSEPSVTGV